MTGKHGDRWVSRRLPDADSPAPFIRRSYPGRGAPRDAWSAMWSALGGGLWLTTEELTVLVACADIEFRASSVARLLRLAHQHGHLDRRLRPIGGRGYAEFARRKQGDASMHAIRVDHD